MDQEIEGVGKNMSNFKTNKYIHVAILGNCWHTPMIVQQDKSGRYWRCAKEECEAVLGRQWDEPQPPDYCSDNSPRRLLNAVEQKLIVDGLHDTYIGKRVGDCPIGTVALFSTAEQIARACVEAHKATDKLRADPAESGE